MKTGLNVAIVGKCDRGLNLADVSDFPVLR